MRKKLVLKMFSGILMITMLSTIGVTSNAISINQNNQSEQDSVEENTNIDIGEDVPEISPRWSTTNHQNKQCNYVIEKLGLNDNQAKWLKEGAAVPDEKYKDIKGFHATQATNYMAGLKAMFMYGQLIGTSGIKDKIVNSMPELGNEKMDFVKQMCNKLESYLNSKGDISNNHKKYIAYGFGLHVLGDMFAHRTMLKQTNLDKMNQGVADSENVKYLQKNDFIDSKISTVKSMIKEGTLNTGNLKEYMKKNKLFTTNYPSKGSTTSNPAEVYEDNPKFMPNRFDAVKKASVSYVSQIRNSSATISNVSLYLSDYNLTLDNIDNYKNKAGIF